MKKKILISYTTYSNSSKSVADIISESFDKRFYDVKLLDITNYSKKITKLANSLFKGSSLDFLNGLLFGLINNKYASLGNEKYAIKGFDTESLRNIFKSFNPDVVLCTHFYSSYIASYYNKINITSSKVVTVITDFTNHSFWLANYKEVDTYVVHNDIIKNELVRKGVKASNIYALGIPVNYEKVTSKETVLKNYSLSGKKPIYLFLAGDNNYEHFKHLARKKYNIDIIMVCGKNSKLKDECEEFVYRNNNKNVLVLGYAKDLYSLIGISDIVITKPGSTIINECISMGKACILLSPQNSLEKFNRRYMTKNHIALKASTPGSLSRKVKLCLSYGFIVKAIRNRLNKFYNNDSATKICSLVKDMLKSSRD